MEPIQIYIKMELECLNEIEKNNNSNFTSLKNSTIVPSKSEKNVSYINGRKNLNILLKIIYQKILMKNLIFHII